jgi:hypothetical protein
MLPLGSENSLATTFFLSWTLVICKKIKSVSSCPISSIFGNNLREPPLFKRICVSRESAINQSWHAVLAINLERGERKFLICLFLFANLELWSF